MVFSNLQKVIKTENHLRHTNLASDNNYDFHIKSIRHREEPEHAVQHGAMWWMDVSNVCWWWKSKEVAVMQQAMVQCWERLLMMASFYCFQHFKDNDVDAIEAHEGI